MARATARDPGQCTRAFGGVEQSFAEPHQPLRSAAGNKSEVENSVGFIPGGIASVLGNRVTEIAPTPRQPMIRDQHLLFPLGPGILDRLPEPYLIYPAFCTGELFQILKAEAGHCKAALGALDHQPLACQPVQRLTNWAEANAERFADLTNAQFCPRRQSGSDNL
ncbi:hypothetical protein D9M68_864790 [compost metagenome]